MSWAGARGLFTKHRLLLGDRGLWGRAFCSWRARPPALFLLLLVIHGNLRLSCTGIDFDTESGNSVWHPLWDTSGAQPVLIDIWSVWLTQ